MTAGLVLAGLLLATIPVALAEPDRRSDRGAERMSARAAERTDRPAQAFTLHLEGTAHDRDNVSYRITIDGEGRGVVKTDENGTAKALRGIARLHITVTDANGTVVKDRMLRAAVRAHLTDDGWKWSLHGFGQREHGMPQVHLRGTATPDVSGGYDLEGAGRAAFAKTEPGPSLRVKVDAIAGTFAKA